MHQRYTTPKFWIKWAPVLIDHFPVAFFLSGCRFSANDVHLFEGISSLTKLFFRLNFPPTLFAWMSFVFTYFFFFGHTRYIRQNYFFSDFNFQTHFFLVLFSTFWTWFPSYTSRAEVFWCLSPPSHCLQRKWVRMGLF